MRDAVRKLAALGPLPDGDLAGQAEIDRFVPLLDEIGLERPSRSETVVLLDALPLDDDESLGLSWTVLHIIESGAEWPMWDELGTRRGWWIDLLRKRLHNAGIEPPALS